MAYDLEEQEQIDEMKAWWKRHGNKVIGVIATLLVAYGGFKGWHYYQGKQALEASAKYEQLSRLSPQDLKEIRTLSADLMDNYAGTPYAARAALLAAKANYASDDANSAKAQLAWVKDNAKEVTIASIGQLQLAALQFDEKHYDDALQTLSQKHDPAYDGLFADLRGDILAAQGKTADAKAAYTEALAKLDPDGRYRQYTQHKLDALGG